MKSVKVVFVRHGSVGRGMDVYASNSDPSLTQEGICQVEGIIEDLRRRDPVRIISSPLKRAVETSRIIANGLNIPFMAETSISGLDTSKINVAELLADIKASGLGWQWYWYLLGWNNLEKCDKYVSRVAKAVCEIIKTAEGPLVLVGHWETYPALASLIGVPLTTALFVDVPNALPFEFNINAAMKRG